MWVGRCTGRSRQPRPGLEPNQVNPDALQGAAGVNLALEDVDVVEAVHETSMRGVGVGFACEWGLVSRGGDQSGFAAAALRLPGYAVTAFVIGFALHARACQGVVIGEADHEACWRLAPA